MKTFWRILIILCAIAALVTFFILQGSHWPSFELPIDSSTANGVRYTISDDQPMVDFYRRINPAVVSLVVFKSDNEFITPVSQGSGFVYDIKGHIITNAHVVNKAEQMDVHFANGFTSPAEIIGIDWYSDLAVLRAQRMPKIQPLTFGDMGELFVGQTVFAIGNPFGQSGTMTRGIISAMGRDILGMTPFQIPGAIQTDAAVNPGNSGGPLLNLRGEVIGVNAQLPQDSGRSNSGVGFAIPASIVQRVIPQLITEGKYIWPWLGAEGKDVDYLLVNAMKLPFEQGAYLDKITVGGPAEAAGLRGSDKAILDQGRSVNVGGDVVVAVGGQVVNSFTDLLTYLAFFTRPQQTIELTILRDGAILHINVKLSERPQVQIMQ